MTNNSVSPTPNRCRLVLIIDDQQAEALNEQALSTILGAGDVASVIFTPGTMDEIAWQPVIESLVATTQKLGIAAIIAGYSRIAGRVGGDGLQLGQDPVAIDEAIEKFAPKLMVGAANVKTRHNALVIGELQPDYIMFGKPGGDTRPQPHPKNIELGDWWSKLVEIPAITLGGSVVESVVDVANSGVEFVALSTAIFVPNADGIDSTAAANNVQLVNQLLDKHAPTFEESDV